MNTGQILYYYYPPGGQQPEVTDYEQRVLAAGGTLQPGDTALLNTFVTTMKDNGTWDGYEYYPFVGGFAGCFEKLNPMNAAISSLTNNGFLAADYTESVGLYNNTTKWIGTGIIPDNEGLSYNNVSYGGYITDQISATARTIFGSRPVSGGVQLYAGRNSVGVNGGGLQKVVPIPGAGLPTFLGLSCRTTETILRFHYTDLLPPPPVASLPPSQTLPDELTIFQVRTFGSIQNAEGKIAFGFVGPSMTRSQMDVLTEAIETFLIGKGRLVRSAEAIIIGDSYTFGTQSSAYNTRYSYLVANTLGIRERNMGIGGALLRSSASTLYGEYDRRDNIYNNNILGTDSIVVLASGLNDCRNDTGSGTPATIADAKAKRITTVNELLNLGVPSSKIVVVGITYIEDGTTTDARIQAWNTAMNDAATETGVRFADVYTPTKANWATIKYTDNVHVTDAGHVIWKDAIITALS